MSEVNDRIIRGRRLHPSILREYDIRGVVGKTLGVEDARSVGHAFGRMAGGGGRRIALARDGRLSSPALRDAVAEGLVAAGALVEDIGVGPTPMLYFAVHHLSAVGGIMVTGSHNPPDHNGFKMVMGYQPVFGAAIGHLSEMAAADHPAGAIGVLEKRSIVEAYVDRLARDFEGGARALDVAWDAGNGAAGEAMAALAMRIPGRHYLLNSEIDGRFPNHHPDPTIPDNLEQLRAVVAERKCDLGVAFDGDGDRIGVVDSRGRILWADQLLMLLARDVLKRKPGATIMADVKASNVLFEDIAAHGGVPMMWKSGHANLRAKLAEIGGPLAGEMSGHIFFADRFYGHDDALYVAVRLLSYLAQSKISLDMIIDSLPHVVNTPEIRFACEDERKFEIVERVVRQSRNLSAEINTIDGIRVSHPQGWWLLRASNTQPALVARCEGRTDDALEQMKDELRASLAAAGIDAPDLD